MFDKLILNRRHLLLCSASVGSISLALMTVVFADGQIGMKNANFSVYYTDIKRLGQSKLLLGRTYNSRSDKSGVFGNGWCSDYETKLSFAERGKILITQCGAGRESSYYVNFATSASDAKLVIDDIAQGIRTARPDLSTSFINGLEKDMVNNGNLRREFLKRLQKRYWVFRERPYLAVDGSGYVVFDGRTFQAFSENGDMSTFDDRGKLTSIKYRDGSYEIVAYEGGHISQITSSYGDYIQFHYLSDSSRLQRVTASNGDNIEYAIESGELREVKPAKGSGGPTYTYRYSADHLHLVDIKLNNEPRAHIDYDYKQDWVKSIIDSSGCSEDFDYRSERKGSKNNQYSYFIRKCIGKTVERGNYEFRYNANDDLKFFTLSSTRENVKIYYDQKQRPQKIDLREHTFSYRYDPAGRIVEFGRDGVTENWYYRVGCSLPSQKYVTPHDVRRKSFMVWIDYNTENCLPRTSKSSDGRSFTVLKANNNVMLLRDQSGMKIEISNESGSVFAPVQIRINGGKSFSINSDGLSFASVNSDPVLGKVLSTFVDLMPQTQGECFCKFDSFHTRSIK